jgi:FMN phosphatase YigB (HAD superfamily)
VQRAWRPAPNGRWDGNVTAPIRNVGALLLDLDETLLDNAHFHASVVRTCEAVAEREPTLTVRTLLDANYAAFADYFHEIEPLWTLGRLSGADVSRESWRRAFAALDIRDAALLDYAIESHRRFGREAHRPFDDVGPLFDAITAMRLPIALVTNGAADSQREKLQALGIEHRFDALVISGEVGRAKPEAAAFEIACERLGVAPERAWHVGDNLATDVAGALAAGCNAIWLNRRGATRLDTDPLPHAEIRSLSELVRALLDG